MGVDGAREIRQHAEGLRRRTEHVAGNLQIALVERLALLREVDDEGKGRRVGIVVERGRPDSPGGR